LIKQCKNCNRQFKGEADLLNGTSRWRLCDQGNLWFNCSCGSTMLLPAKEGKWFDPSKALSSEAREVFHRLKNINELPRIPNGIAQAQSLASSSDFNPQAIAKALRLEPITAAGVVGHASLISRSRDPNSAPIKTLEHAIVFIGQKSLQDFLAAAALRGLKLPQTGFDYDGFWRHSFLVGAIADAITPLYKLEEEPNQIYLAGALCNIGKLVTNFCFASHVPAILADTRNPKIALTWRASESANNLPEHTLLGEIAACIWGLPESISDAARWHHDPQNTTEPEAKIAAFANQLAHWLLVDPTMLEYEILTECRRSLGLSEKDLDQIVSRLQVLRTSVSAA
jgi:HD-like signal output (HDOD) protein